jgi:MFS family permease
METRRPALLTPTLRWFLAGMVLANIASEMVFSLLPLYLAELGTSVADIGLVFSLASAAMLVLQLFGGWVSDVIGRLRAIALGSAVATVGYFGLVLATSWPLALLAICLEYVSGALVAPSFTAFIAEQSSEENRGRVFGISQGIYMIVTVIGPPLAGFLTLRWGFKPMLLLAAGLYALAALLRVWMARRVPQPPSSQTEGRERLSLRQFAKHLAGFGGLVLGGGILTWVLVTDGVRDVASQLSNDLQPLFFKQVGGLNVEQIGLLGSIFGVATMLTTFLSGWVVDHWSERLAIVAGYILQFCGIVVFLLADSFWGFGASALLVGFGVGMMSPAYNTLVSKVVPENMRGMAFGLFQSSIGLVSLPAPWLGAQLWTRFNPRLPFAISAAAALGVILPVWLKFRRPRPVKQSSN